MFQSITISNFKSYADAVTMDFRANRSNSLVKSLYSNPYQARGPRISRFNIMFGPNGSGKSTFIEAVAFFRFVITRRMPKKGIDKLPNLFYARTLGSVGSFSSTFFIGELKSAATYCLSVDYHEHCIVKESLSIGKNLVYSWTLNSDGFPQVTARPTVMSSKLDREVFSRRIQDFEAERHPEETLLHVLSAVRKDPSKLNGAELFFRPLLAAFYKIVIFTPMPQQYEDIKETLAGEGVNTDYAMKTLKDLGLKIEHIRLERVSADLFAEAAGISLQDLEELSVSLKKGLEPGEKKSFIYFDRPFYYGLENDELAFYKLVLDYGGGIKLDFSTESSGNQKIINMASIIFAGSQADSVFLIDEVDRSLHTSLAKTLIAKIIETNTATQRQFLFTAHDPNLLDVGLFRKDGLFFVENADYRSKIVRLDETGIRIDRDIRKKYIGGKIHSPIKG